MVVGPEPVKLTDRQIRIGSAAVVPLTLLGMAAAYHLLSRDELTTGGLVVLGLGPFGLFYGIAGLICPDVIRAASKYGAHLPLKYKLIAAAVGIGALACSLAVTAMLLWG